MRTRPRMIITPQETDIDIANRQLERDINRLSRSMKYALTGMMGEVMIAQERVIREKVVGNSQITADSNHRAKSVEICPEGSARPQRVSSCQTYDSQQKSRSPNE